MSGSTKLYKVHICYEYLLGSKMFLVNNLLFYDTMPLFITWLRYKRILLPPCKSRRPGILNIKVMLAALAIILISMDKKFIMTIMNFKWSLYMSSINKVQSRWDLSFKTSFSPFLCFLEPNTVQKFKFLQTQHATSWRTEFLQKRFYVFVTGETVLSKIYS